VKMKILIIGKFRPKKWVRITGEESFARIFGEMGHDVFRCEIREGIKAVRSTVKEARSDWILLSKDFSWSRREVEMLREAGARRIALWLFDSMYAWGRLRWFRDTASACDLAIVKEKGLLPLFLRWGINAVYLDEGFDPKIVHPGIKRDSLCAEVGFLGSFYKGKLLRKSLRTKTIVAFSQKFRLKVWSQHTDKYRRLGIEAFPPLFDEQVGDVSASCDVILGVDKTHSIEGFWSDRIYLVTGTAGFYLCRYTKGLETIFENHRHIVWFSETDEGIDLATHYIKSEKERRRIAESGYEHALAHHSRYRRGEQLLKILKDNL